MITGDIKNQIDAIWNAFWSGGISNPSRGARDGGCRLMSTLAQSTLLLLSALERKSTEKTKRQTGSQSAKRLGIGTVGLTPATSPRLLDRQNVRVMPTRDADKWPMAGTGVV